MQSIFVIHQEYSRGPCPKGKLMVLDRETGYGKCSCDTNLVSIFKTLAHFKMSMSCIYYNTYLLFFSGCIFMSRLVNVSSFTNKVLVRKGISSPSTMVVCHRNANAKMDFTCIQTENATDSTLEVVLGLYSY